MTCNHSSRPCALLLDGVTCIHLSAPERGACFDLTEREKLEALVAWLPVFGTDFVAGRIKGGDEISDGVFRLPYASYHEDVLRFEQALYDAGWILPGFDWGTWAKSDDARAILNETMSIASLDPMTLAKILTVLVRSSRFCEGALLAAFDSGQIPAVLRRAEELLRALPEERD